MVYISNRLNGIYLVITCITLRNTKIIINSFFTNKKTPKIYEYIYSELYPEIKDRYFFLIF